MYVVTVDFVVSADRASAFRSAVIENARRSLANEPGCRQFDVCAKPDDGCAFLLYEIYDDRAAFDAHLASDHFKAFDAQVADWVERKEIRTWSRIEPT